MNVNIRPEYSSDEYSDVDDYDMDYIPRKKTNYHQIVEKDYQTLLYESAMYDTPDQFVTLLKNNSNKYDFDYNGWTLLMVAASHGQYEKMKYLLDHGADVNYNYNLFTPLLAVCDSTKPESDLMKCIELLQEFKVDLNVEDRHGITPLMYASRHGYVNIVKHLLIKCPDSVNKVDSESLSALFYAVMNNHAEVVEVLLDAKASTTFHDLHGRTVLEIAVLKQYNDIIELLHPGYQQQQEDELVAAQQEKSSQVVYDYITLCKNNLPSDNIESTGFYTNVIQMLSACELLDFSSDIIEQQMSLFEFLNIDCDKLRQNSIHLDYQRNEILKSLKQFHLHKWKLSRSMVTRTNKKNIKLDELIHYIYLICEQMYVNYSALQYIENHNIRIKTLLENYNSKDHVKTLLRLSDILNKYERFVEGTILKKCCLHPAGLIEDPDNNSKSVLYYIIPSIGLAVTLFYCCMR